MIKERSSCHGYSKKKCAKHTKDRFHRRNNENEKIDISNNVCFPFPYQINSWCYSSFRRRRRREEGSFFCLQFGFPFSLSGEKLLFFYNKKLRILSENGKFFLSQLEKYFTFNWASWNVL